MLTDQAALSTTSNNIANANTPGYSRQTVDLAEVSPVEYGGLLVGNGVQLQQVVSQRSSLLQTQLDQETQQQSKYNSYLGSMQQVQTLFNETSGTGLQSSLSGFFNSLQQLSTSPSDTSLRAGVLSAAQNLAQGFSSTASNLVSQQRSADMSVTQSVGQINSLTAQIAQLNGEVSTATSTGQKPGPVSRPARPADQPTVRPGGSLGNPGGQQQPDPDHHRRGQPGGGEPELSADHAGRSIHRFSAGSVAGGQHHLQHQREARWAEPSKRAIRASRRCSLPWTHWPPISRMPSTPSTRPART
jgi:hypothetical protein